MGAYLLSFFAYASSYVSRKAYSACMTGICASLGITKAFAGAVSTGYLACYGTGQLVFGLLSDRTSPRVMIALGLGGAGICNIFMGSAGSGWAMLVIWCLNGMFNSMMWSSVVKTIANWVPDGKRRFCATSITASMSIGSIGSYLIASACLRSLDWRATFRICGAIVVLYALVWVFGTKALGAYIDGMEERARDLVKQSAGGNADAGGRKGMGLLSCILTTGILFTIGGILFNGIIKDGVTEWIPTYFTEFYGMEASASSAIAVMLPVVSVAGSYLAGFVNGRVRNEMATSGILFALCAACIALLRLPVGSSPAVGAVALGVAVMAMHGVNNQFLTIMPLNFAKVGRSSSVSGVLNASSYLSAALSSTIIGVMAQNSGWNATVGFWLVAASAGVALCLVGAPVWSRGRKRIG